MYFILTTAIAIATLLFRPALTAPQVTERVYFDCTSSSSSGFSPKCCTDINGQVGVNCVGAHIMGATNPIYECNLYVYNITGCCQSTGYKNPTTENTLDLCAMTIDRI
ncbi:hypothetical protein GGR50DRAFT_659770 [Xylaria sp. CBS 124048]|nr:hypothetical protein GGR50DRAFT_659770 [Xylaria sp. CBS 124048]